MSVSFPAAGNTVTAPLPTSTFSLTTTPTDDTSQAVVVTGRRIRLTQQIVNANLRTITPSLSWTGGTLSTMTSYVDFFSSSSTVRVWGTASTILEQSPTSPITGSLAVANTGGFIMSVVFELYFSAVSTVTLTPRWSANTSDTAYYRFTQATVLD